jgi:hypothetical protein
MLSGDPPARRDRGFTIVGLLDELEQEAQRRKASVGDAETQARA